MIVAVPARGHMPFPGHRTVAEVDGEQQRFWVVKPWCAQCEQRVSKRTAVHCADPHCKIRERAAA